MSDQQQVASHHYSMLHKVLCIPRINTMVPELPILKRNGNKSIRNTKEKQTSPTFSSQEIKHLAQCIGYKQVFSKCLWYIRRKIGILIDHTNSQKVFPSKNYQLAYPKNGIFYIKMIVKELRGGPVVKNLPSNAGDTGSIPGQGTKISHATGQLRPHATTTELTCHNQTEARAPQLRPDADKNKYF